MLSCQELPHAVAVYMIFVPNANNATLFLFRCFWLFSARDVLSRPFLLFETICAHALSFCESAGFCEKRSKSVWATENLRGVAAFS